MAGFFELDYARNGQNFCLARTSGGISWPDQNNRRPGVQAVLAAYPSATTGRQTWLEVEPGVSLLEAETVLAQHPEIVMVCVMRAGRLEGLVGLDTFYQRLALYLAPAQLGGMSDQPYLTSTPDPTLGEIMSAPTSLRLEDDASRAYLLMQKYRLPALPVLDATGQIVACLELKHLAHFWAQQII
jgi:CBS domain-containing protein